MEHSPKVDLIKIVLSKLKEEDPETHSKITSLKELIKIDEIIRDRYSILFLFDLFSLFERGTLNIDTVMYEVKFLEGMEDVSRTKEATEFRRPPLQGLWHKHYYDGSLSALAQNAKNALNNYGMPYVEKMVEEARSSNEERFMTPEDIPHIVNDVITSNLQRRQNDQKTTGEWLVYAIHESRKYYLCLAKHSDGDEQIRNRIDSSCIHYFPFLQQVLP